MVDSLLPVNEDFEFEVVEPEGLENEFEFEPVSETGGIDWTERKIAEGIKPTPESNLERMGERLSTSGTAAGAGVLKMSAEAKAPTNVGEAAMGLAENMIGSYDPEGNEFWNQIKSMSAIPQTLAEFAISSVAEAGWDLADFLMKDDEDPEAEPARDAIRELQPLIQEEANETLGDPNMQYEGNAVQKIGWEIAEGATRMAPALVAGWATKNPGVSLGIIGGDVAGTTYADVMERTGSHEKAVAAAKFNVMAEVIPEALPVTAALRKTGISSGLSRFLEASLGEGAQEVITEILQSTYDMTELEGMTLVDAIRNIDWNQVGHAFIVGTGVGTVISTPGTIGDFMEGRRQKKLDQQAKAQQAAQATEPKLGQVDSLEANATAIDTALEATEGMDPEEVPDGDGPEITVQDMRDSTPDGILAQESERQQAMADVEAAMREEFPNASDEEIRMVVQAAMQDEAEVSAATQEMDQRRAEEEQAAEESIEMDLDLNEEAVDTQGVLAGVEAEIQRREKGEESPKYNIYEQQSDELLSQTRDRLRGELGKKDEITREEVVQATENVEPTGEAIETAEEYRTAKPEFAGTIFSHKPGDERGDDTTAHYYGEIAETEDADGMPIDVVLNKDYDAEADTPVFVVDQIRDGEFYQHKVMAGFADQAAAEQAYTDMWADAEMSGITQMTAEEFQDWRDNGDHQSPIVPRETSEPAAVESPEPDTTPVVEPEPAVEDTQNAQQTEPVEETATEEESRETEILTNASQYDYPRDAKGKYTGERLVHKDRGSLTRAEEHKAEFDRIEPILQGKTVADLKAMLEDAGARTTGSKQELIERIQLVKYATDQYGKYETMEELEAAFNNAEISREELRYLGDQVMGERWATPFGTFQNLLMKALRDKAPTRKTIELSEKGKAEAKAAREAYKNREPTQRDLNKEKTPEELYPKEAPVEPNAKAYMPEKPGVAMSLSQNHELVDQETYAINRDAYNKAVDDLAAIGWTRASAEAFMRAPDNAGFEVPDYITEPLDIMRDASQGLELFNEGLRTLKKGDGRAQSRNMAEKVARARTVNYRVGKKPNRKQIAEILKKEYPYVWENMSEKMDPKNPLYQLLPGNVPRFQDVLEQSIAGNVEFDAISNLEPVTIEMDDGSTITASPADILELIDQRLLKCEKVRKCG